MPGGIGINSRSGELPCRPQGDARIGRGDLNGHQGNPVPANCPTSTSTPASRKKDNSENQQRKQPKTREHPFLPEHFLHVPLQLRGRFTRLIDTEEYFVINRKKLYRGARGILLSQRYGKAAYRSLPLPPTGQRSAGNSQLRSRLQGTSRATRGKGTSQKSTSQKLASRPGFMKKGASAESRNPFDYSNGAEGGTRTPTGFPTTPCAFEKDRLDSKKICSPSLHLEQYPPHSSP